MAFNRPLRNPMIGEIADPSRDEIGDRHFSAACQNG